MIVLLTDLDGVEHRLAVADGRFVDPGSQYSEIRDLRRFFAIAGLADCHTHLSGDDVRDMIEPDGAPVAVKMQRNALAHLEAGVLLIADKGSRTSVSLRFLDEEETQRPHIQMAGAMITVPGGYYPGFGTEVGAMELFDVIAEASLGGATWVKLVGDWPRRGRGAIPNFTEDQLSKVVSIAHRAGCRVAIHTTAPDTPGMAVRAGVDSIEHGLFLTEDDIAELGDRGGAWVPTIIAMESTANWLGAASSGGRMFAAGLANVRAHLGTAADAGVAVLAGTDLAIPHGAVAREAVRLVEYGMGPRRAVAAASSAAYTYLGFRGDFAVGSSADFVLFENDPRQDVSELQRPACVMRAGRVVAGCA